MLYSSSNVSAIREKCFFEGFKTNSLTSSGSQFNVDSVNGFRGRY